MTAAALHLREPGPEPAASPWREAKGRLSREAFVSAHDYPFLVVSPPLSGTTREFHTRIRRDLLASSPGPVTPPLDEACHILPLTKSESNPYEGRVILGRARNCDVVLPDAAVSKVHAEARVTQRDAVVLVDRGSSNGTFVRGVRLRRGDEVVVSSGDPVRLGTVEAVLLSAGDLYDHL
jgi:hypothetical protein